jgi:hypothetical protein
MKFKLVFTVFLLVGTIQRSSTETPVPQSLSEALVFDLYKQKNSPFFQTKDHGLVDKYFSERLAQLIWKNALSSKDEVGALDFDPRYDAQDTDIKKFSLRKSKSGKDGAEVIASFENMGSQNRNHVLSCPYKNGVGKFPISDMRTAEIWSVS